MDILDSYSIYNSRTTAPISINFDLLNFPPRRRALEILKYRLDSLKNRHERYLNP